MLASEVLVVFLWVPEFKVGCIRGRGSSGWLKTFAHISVIFDRNSFFFEDVSTFWIWIRIGNVLLPSGIRNCHLDILTNRRRVFR